MDLAEQVVDAVNATFGAHDGRRALHAKGTLLRGTFTATPEGTRLSRAAHMSGEPVPGTVRASNAGGDPGEPDFARVGRGLAVKLYLPDGTATDLVATNSPSFIARTPEDFLELMEARRPPDGPGGQPDMERIGAYIQAHPEALPAIQAALGTAPPASYARVRFNGLHAFRFVDGDGAGRWGRWHWEPEQGEATMPDDEARTLGPDYLQRDIAERAERRQAAWSLVVTLAEDGDPIEDPSAPWPDERETVVAGRLELTGLDTERERDGDILVFDPMRVTDGIEPSDDPILRFRPRAYAVSVERRTGHPSPFS